LAGEKEMRENLPAREDVGWGGKNGKSTVMKKKMGRRESRGDVKPKGSGPTFLNISEQGTESRRGELRIEGMKGEK